MRVPNPLVPAEVLAMSALSLFNTHCAKLVVERVKRRNNPSVVVLELE